MSSLRDVSFPPTLDTSDDDLVKDFFTPALAQAREYDRAVGYFSSGWLKENAKGMAEFAANGGRARWIASPIMSEEDWEAMHHTPERYSTALDRIALRNIRKLREELEHRTLNALAWMIADGILEFRLALPQKKLAGGDFHTKFGIFRGSSDEVVVFTGSYNDSVQGFRNHETISVFWSWEPLYLYHTKAHEQRFRKLWEDRDENVRVFTLPAAAREEILQLRTGGRPYSRSETPQQERLRLPKVPENIQLRPYQEQAISSWVDNEHSGLFEMATGTGKTITALAASAQRFQARGRGVLLIVCPFVHLVDQWADEAENFGFRSIRVGGGNDWETPLGQQLRNYRRQRQDIVTIITTNRSLLSDTLNTLLRDHLGDVLLIADEVHNLGATQTRQWLESVGEAIPLRLALSATPIRQYDEEGTAALDSYFGGTVFSLGLEEAIGTYLTEYEYFPHPVELTEDEFADYCDLTRKIGRAIAAAGLEEMPESAERLAIQRARVLNNASNKLEWIRSNIDPDDIKLALFYVGDQIFDDARKLLGFDMKIKVAEFTGRQSRRDRQRLLEQFSDQDLQALIAMKCLDEGVDVPPTRVAYFLASSGNPREFIQRRGRVLRQYPGKKLATVHDLISIPPEHFLHVGRGHPDYSAVRSAFRREYLRVKEFANLAVNGYTALTPFFEIADSLDLLGEE